MAEINGRRYLTVGWLAGVLLAIASFFTIGWIRAVDHTRDTVMEHATQIKVQEEVLQGMRHDLVEIKTDLRKLLDRSR